MVVMLVVSQLIWKFYLKTAIAAQSCFFVSVCVCYVESALTLGQPMNE